MKDNDTAQELLANLRDAMRTELDRLLPYGQPVAHVGFPDHWNAGDSAIWLGEEALLAERGCKVVYQCSLRNYAPTVMRQRAAAATIVICGGGNLGDLWPNHQKFREQILQDFPDHPVIQMPQSICFEKPEALECFQRISAGHRRFHLLLRDRVSLEAARAKFDVASSPCPDASCGLGVLPRDAAPVGDIMALMRSDKEADPQAELIPTAGVLKADWIEFTDEDDTLRQAAEIIGQRIAKLHGDLAAGVSNAGASFAEIGPLATQLAWLRLHRGLRYIARGRVLITDRLHGHLLALALSVPHILIDNANHKSRALFETWTSGSPLCSWASSGSSALALAQQKLRDMGR